MPKIFFFIFLFCAILNWGAQCNASVSINQNDFCQSTTQNESINIFFGITENEREFHLDSILSKVEYNVAIGNNFIVQNKYDSALIYFEKALSFPYLSKSNTFSKNASKEAKQYFKLYKKYLNKNDTIILSYIENWRRNESKNQWEFNRAVGDFYLEKNLDSATSYYFKCIVSCPFEINMEWRSEILWNLSNRCQDIENFIGAYVFSHLIPSQNWLTPKIYEADALLNIGEVNKSIIKLHELDSMIQSGTKYNGWDLYNLAYLFHENQLFTKALFYYEKYANEGKIEKHDLKEVEYLISNVYYECGNYYRSLGILLVLHDFYQNPKNAINSKIDLIELKYEIASTYSSVGDFEKSQYYLAEYRKSIDSVQFPKDYWRAINLMGNNYMDFGKYRNAVESYEYAIGFYNKYVIGDTKSGALDLSINYSGISNAYQEMGNFDAAIQIDELNRRIIADNYPKNSPEYINSLIALSTSYFYSGNSESSLIYLKEIDSLLLSTLSIDPLVLATIENNRIISFLEKKDFKSALKSMDKSIDYLKESQGNSFTPNVIVRIMNKADIFNEMGDKDSAIYYCRKGVELSRGLYEDQHPDLNYRTSLLARYLLDNEELDEAYALYSKVYDNFILEIYQSFTWLNYLERELFWEDKNQFCNDINNLAYKVSDQLQGSFKLSYNANLISKSLLLETSRELDQAVSQSSDEEMKAQFTEMKQLRKLYSKMQSEGSSNKEVMERYKVQADSLDKILVNKLGEYAASKRKFEITWKDVQSNLTTSDAAIEFARYYDDKDSLYKYMALVVRPDYEYPKLVRLGEEDAIRTAAQNKDFSSLYNEAWKGIDSLLVGVKRVYYSPAGELNNVSFSALCTEEGNELVATNKDKNRGVVIGNNQTTTKACNAVLMDKYELHQLTTTRYLADGTLKKEKPMQPSLALVGGINFDDIPDQTNEDAKELSNEDFAFQTYLSQESRRSSSNYGKKMDPLPGTKEEVINIAGLLNTSNWKVQTKSDKKAGEYEFKKELETKAPGVLHIATHGFAFPDEAKKESKLMDMNQTSTYKVSEDPMVRCGLMLGGSNISWTGNPQKMIEQTGDDGILTAAEVANLDLTNTKLVVLSACETGLGKIEGSEGTFGLKRGFKLAGVEQMIVSLWSVPDKETMELMTLFYSDLTKTLNPVTSFEKAQQEMRTKYPTDPEKWAGFVLVR